MLSHLDWLTFITVLSICFYHWYGAVGEHHSSLKAWADLDFRVNDYSEPDLDGRVSPDTAQQDELVQTPPSSHHHLVKLLKSAPRIKNQLPVIDNVINNARDAHITRMQSAMTSNTLVGLIGTIIGIFIALNVIDLEQQSVDIFIRIALDVPDSTVARVRINYTEKGDQQIKLVKDFVEEIRGTFSEMKLFDIDKSAI